MSYRFPSASQLEKISVTELKKYINSVNQAAKAVDEEPVSRLTSLKSSNTAQYIDDVMELSKKLTASKLKNKGARPAVISKLTKAIDEAKVGGAPRKSAKRAKSRKASRARKSASRSRKATQSRRKSRRPARKHHRSASRTKKKSSTSGLGCEVPLSTCVKDTKNYKIADIRALAERCGVSTTAGGKNKTRAELCRDIVAANSGGAGEVPSADIGAAAGMPTQGDEAISDNERA